MSTAEPADLIETTSAESRFAASSKELLVLVEDACVLVGDQPAARADVAREHLARVEGRLVDRADVLVEGNRPRGWELDRDPYYLEASVPGVFAAGDVRANSVKRVASAVGEGAMAIQLVHGYVELR